MEGDFCGGHLKGHHDGAFIQAKGATDLAGPWEEYILRSLRLWFDCQGPEVLAQGFSTPSRTG